MKSEIIINQYFCPRCHRQIEIPAFLKKGNVKAEKGVTIICGYCKKGKVKIMLPEIKTSTASMVV